MDPGGTRHRRRVLLTAIKPTGLLQRQTASSGAVCFLCLPRYGQFCGGAQAWDAAGYERNARFVSDLGAEVLDLLAAKPDETILDLGCGDGALTERIAASGVRVRGCDASPEFVRAARMRGLDVDEADGHALPYFAQFDAVFSNAALHWMTRPARLPE